MGLAPAVESAPVAAAESALVLAPASAKAAAVESVAVFSEWAAVLANPV
jgi:hypothetical protein